ncbi:MAG: serpin family protein [Bacteroidota bacterium]|nr:serpin family protein [Bacteroidota bacterium]
MKSICLLFLLSAFMISCAKEKTPINNMQIQPIALTAAQKALVQSNNQFAFTLFNKAGTQETNDNLFISPFSVSVALSMTLNGAGGSTKTGMGNTLGFSGQDLIAINDYNKLLSNQLQHIDNAVTFNIANSIWYRNTFSVSSSFITTNKTYYNAEVSALDFTSPSAVNTINNWVSAKTNNAIPNIITIIPSNMVMYLINAIYFKGSWSNKFDAAKTSDQNFYKEDQTVVQCKMMTQNTTFPVYTNDTYTAVELPYGQGNFLMTILLPNTGKTTADVITNFNAENWNAINDGLVPTSIQINFPRFKTSYETTLNSLLSSMGMADAFNSNIADFTGINAQGGLYISEVKHKTMVEVNEEGTVAAAVTSVGITITAIMEPRIINVNKPFVFVISEKSTGAILFTGRIMDPTKE